MTNPQMHDLEVLRQQAESIKEEIKQKRRECRDTTMQQVCFTKISLFSRENFDNTVTMPSGELGNLAPGGGVNIC